MRPEELRDRTAAFSTRVTIWTRSLTGAPETRHVAQQLTRSATSVASNYRAAGLGRSRVEFIAKLGVVLEEADETVYWLEFLRDTRAAGDPNLAALLTEARELVRIFSASVRTARTNQRQLRRR